jgi:TorA maturation chaperone TorD
MRAKRTMQGSSRAVAPRLVRREQERERVLAAAALYRVIALGFSYPEPMLINSVRQATVDLVRAVGRGAVSPVLASALPALLRAWRATTAETLAAEHSRLFLGAGIVPLREGGYGDGMRFAGQPVDIADLNGFYLAFGFGPVPSAPNPPDHLGTELEYLSLLHLKKAYALQRSRLSQAKIVEHAMARFLEDHLGRWVAAVEAALRDASGAAPYVLLAKLMERAVAADCARLGVRPTAAGIGNAIDPLQSDTLRCPLANGKPAKQRRGLPETPQFKVPFTTSP